LDAVSTLRRWRRRRRRRGGSGRSIEDDCSEHVVRLHLVGGPRPCSQVVVVVAVVVEEGVCGMGGRRRKRRRPSFMGDSRI